MKLVDIQFIWYEAFYLELPLKTNVSVIGPLSKHVHNTPFKEAIL